VQVRGTADVRVAPAGLAPGTRREGQGGAAGRRRGPGRPARPDRRGVEAAAGRVAAFRPAGRVPCAAVDRPAAPQAHGALPEGRPRRHGCRLCNGRRAPPAPGDIVRRWHFTGTSGRRQHGVPFPDAVDGIPGQQRRVCVPRAEQVQPAAAAAPGGACARRGRAIRRAETPDDRGGLVRCQRLLWQVHDQARLRATFGQRHRQVGGSRPGEERRGRAVPALLISSMPTVATATRHHRPRRSRRRTDGPLSAPTPMPARLACARRGC
jgi:hypothetical protein